MEVKEESNVFTCECSFSWPRGQSGSHDCSIGLRRQITELKAALETERSDVRDISAAWAKNEKELELRRAADKNCFMYGIVDPDGNAHIDELCVSLDRGIIETEVDALNNDTGTDGYRVVSLKTSPADSCTLPPFTEALEQILGRPNFMCSEIAGILRMSGLEIKRKSECEQAAVIYWMLGIYLEHGASWWSVARANLAAVIEAHNV